MNAHCLPLSDIIVPYDRQHAGREICAEISVLLLQVERLDDPSLIGVPLAVRQFNAGGFVAVSYEVSIGIPHLFMHQIYIST